MCSKDFLAEIPRKFIDAFKSQNPKLFDVVFDFNGKKLYADKKWLSLASTTFESMLSERWISKNDVIKIKSYKYEDFKKFLIFIYTGECKLNDENIFVMLDMAEFYQINQLKVLCDKYLSKLELTLFNIFQFLEISNKYSMIQLKKPIHDFIIENFLTFVKSDNYLNVDKAVIKEILTMTSNAIVKPENVFQAVYEWAEHQATVKQQELSCEESLNDLIKNQITEFLPFIEFKKMDLSFFTQYVVKRGFLFSYEELSDILECVRLNVKVRVTNLHGNSICGTLLHENNAIVQVIKSVCNRESKNRQCEMIYWRTESKSPSIPSPLKERDGVPFYLICYTDGVIGVKHHCDIYVDENLIAEMFSETDFVFTPKCKIEIA